MHARWLLGHQAGQGSVRAALVIRFLDPPLGHVVRALQLPTASAGADGFAIRHFDAMPMHVHGTVGKTRKPTN